MLNLHDMFLAASVIDNSCTLFEAPPFAGHRKAPVASMTSGCGSRVARIAEGVGFTSSVR